MSITCPICNKTGFKKLMHHVTKIHGLDKDEFLSIYPNYPTITEELSKRISKKLRDNWDDDNYRENQKEKLLKNWEDPNYRKKQSKSRKESWENNPERQANYYKWFWSEESNKKRTEGVIKSLENPEVLEKRKEQFSVAVKSEKRLDNLRKKAKTKETKNRVGQASKKAWENNDKRRSNQSKLMSNLWENPKTRDAMLDKKLKPGSHKYTNLKGDLLLLRSNWELIVAEQLDELRIEYEFELRRFDYYLDNKKHKYTPDFYLNKYDIYIEVKPSFYLNHPINKLKWESVISGGNTLIIITENELNEVDKIIKLLEEGSEVMAYASRVQENSKQEASNT